MKRLLTAALPLLFCSAAAAQTPPAQLGAANVPAPWWMKEPVIASVGNVRVELPANRASFSATFSVVDKTAADASAKAAAQVRALSRSLAVLGSDKVQIDTALITRPLYDQYKNKEGQVLENQRADKVDSYEVDATLSIQVRDLTILESVYAEVLAARPTSIDRVGFQLQATNEVNTRLQSEAVKDAARRARLAAEAAGARLTGVKVIDPSGRACQTDVLAGWPSYQNAPSPHTVEPDEVGAPPPPPPPPPPSPSAATVSRDLQLTLQAPLRELTDTACVVYGLAG